MKFDLNVLFVLRRAQTDMKGLAPISLRITVNGGRAELSTGRKVDPKKLEHIMTLLMHLRCNSQKIWKNGITKM